jgi:choline dehydrogenase
MADPDYLAVQNAQYNAKRTGINTNPGGTIISFEKLPKGTISQSTRNDLDAAHGGDWPDVEYFAQDAFASTNDDYLLSAPDISNYTAMAATVIAPFSRGNVTIKSKDTADHPLVNPNWLTDPRDMEVLIAAFKRLRQLFKTKAVQPMLVGDEVYPGTDVQTDAQIEATIRRSADTVFHPACTCRMGKEGDSMAVSDSKARVFGVKGLRVVDASAFPKLIPGHPQGTVYGLAEKIAYEILSDN